MWHLWLPRVALEGVGEPLVMAWKPKPDHLQGLPYRSGLVIGYRPSDTSVGSEPPRGTNRVPMVPMLFGGPTLPCWAQPPLMCPEDDAPEVQQ
jgi:hypothetical protein